MLVGLIVPLINIVVDVEHIKSPFRGLLISTVRA
jgi:hypothetical protein